MLTDNIRLDKTDDFGSILDDKEIIDAPKIDITQTILKVSKVAEMSELEEQRLLETFNTFKFVIIECEPLPNPKENLLALKKFCGSIKKHKRSDENGITSVEKLEYSLENADQMSATNKTFTMHTDGSFELVPPKIVAMQCIVPSQNGGISQIVYAKSVYEYFRENYLDELQKLLTYPLMITRGNKTATKFIIVEEKGRFFMHFRSDVIVSLVIPPQLEKAFNIIKAYVNEPNNQLMFKLQANQIVLFDNTSVLHGRTSFPDNEFRKLNRIWFDGISEYAHHLQLGFIPKFKLLSSGQN